MSAFHNSKFETYQAEAREKWGSTHAYRQYEEKRYTERQHRDLMGETDRIMAEFAARMKRGEASHSAEARSLVRLLQDHITRHYYRCTDEILAGLGQMYLADERFKHNIDKHGDGTAAFVSQAIEVYCRK